MMSCDHEGDPIEINRPILLFVEGKDQCYFFLSVLSKMSIDRIQIINYRGIHDFSGLFSLYCKQSNFYTEILSIGIVMDAETNADASFQRICSALDKNHLQKPSKPLEKTGERPYITILILPGNQPTGMLEDLCLESIQQDPTMECVEDFIKCLESKVKIQIQKLAKTRLYAFNASREKPGLKIAEAFNAGYYPFDNVCFNQLKSFINIISV
jgi:hypothetical protein